MTEEDVFVGTYVRTYVPVERYFIGGDGVTHLDTVCTSPVCANNPPATKRTTVIIVLYEYPIYTCLYKAVYIERSTVKHIEPRFQHVQVL